MLTWLYCLSVKMSPTLIFHMSIYYLYCFSFWKKYAKVVYGNARRHITARALQWLSGWNIPPTSISWCSIHPKQTPPCALLLFTERLQSLDGSGMWWLKTQLAELPKCAAAALLCSLSWFLLRGEAGVGWRRFDHLGECGPKWLLCVRGEDNGSQLQKDGCLTWANELPGWTELHHACFL